MRKIILFIIIIAVLLLTVSMAVNSANIGNVKEIEWILYNYNDSELLTDSLTAITLEEGFVLKPDDVKNFIFDVPENGDYYLDVRYRPVLNSGKALSIRVKTDGGEAGLNEIKTLNRIWKGGDKPLRSNSGNDIRSLQNEVGVWVTEPVIDGDASELLLQLNEGKHEITIEGASDKIEISQISLRLKKNKDYNTYKNENAGKPDNTPKDYIQKIQAENMYQKSDTAVYATFDRTSPKTEPYHPTQMRLNTIGGSGSWYKLGEWASWEIIAPESGWYNIGLRWRQNNAKGFFSTRSLKIDGEILFKEFSDLRFNYGDGWNNTIFSSKEKESYSVYLEKGKHVLSLQNTLGSLSDSVNKMNKTLYTLNEIYREILMVTGFTPDIMRDYELFKNIPGLKEKLENVLSEINIHISELQMLAGDGELALNILPELAAQIEKFAKSDYNIPNEISNLSGNLSAFADWLFEIADQPLEIDYLYICGSGIKPDRAEADLFGKASHEFASFIGSFSQDYNSMDMGETSERSVKVWINLGRDQCYVIRRLIDEKFTPETGISVKLEVAQGALLKAVTAGRGPDVNLFARRGEAMNLAYRGALMSLDDLMEFSETKKNYMDSAFIPYEFNGKTYGMPATTSFFMMFVRNDIFEDLGLKAPTTWEEMEDIAPLLQTRNLEIGLPYQNLDAYALMGNGIGTLNIFPTLLTQMNQKLYNDYFTGTLLDEPTAQAAFVKWTGYYKDYGYTLYKDNFNRFRSGEMPLIIDEYTFYNRLAGSAPEIKGTWSMQAIPGILQADGTINNQTNANGMADIILENCEDYMASWEFLKWWQSAEIQAAFARDLEDQVSVMARYVPANIRALEFSYWTDDERETLLSQWEKVVEIPEIPGGFYVIRNVDNAFREVYYQNINPMEALYKWNKATNREIISKRNELGLQTSE